LISVGRCSLIPALSLGPWRAGLDEHYTLVARSFKEKCPLGSWRTGWTRSKSRHQKNQSA